MKTGKKKKAVILILSVSLCIIAGIFIFMGIDSTRKIIAEIESQWVDKSGQTVVQQFGQPITIEYTTSNMPGPLKTTVIIFLNKYDSITYHSDGDFVMPDIKLIYQKDGLECYEWSDKYNCIITYQYKGSAIKGYPNVMEEPDEKLLYPVAKQEFMTHDFRRIKLFGELLVKQNDKEAIEQLKKYAENSFTQEELQLNSKNNKLTNNQIQSFADELSQKYKF